MEAPLVRLATRDDVHSLAALRAEWTTGKHQVDLTGFVEHFTMWFDAEAVRRRFWLAAVDGRDVGMVNLTVFDRMPAPGAPSGCWGYLGNMFVSEPHRNRGVGRLLVDALLRHADADGLERVVLRPTERARPFYARRGFAHADDLLLVRPIPPVG